MGTEKQEKMQEERRKKRNTDKSNIDKRKKPKRLKITTDTGLIIIVIMNYLTYLVQKKLRMILTIMII